MADATGPWQVVIAGAGYAGLHAALRLGAWRERERRANLTLIDQRAYHQVVTELPRVAAGTRTPDAVKIPLERVLDRQVRFVQTTVTGFNLAERQLGTEAGPIPYTRLVLALGSRPNDFGIPGLAERALTLYTADDAERVWRAVNDSVTAAAAEQDTARRRRLLTVVVGGGGATGVELAGELAETLPPLLRATSLPPDLARVVIVEAGRTILAGSSPELVAKASGILGDLGVDVRTNAQIAEATADGFRLKSGEVVEGGVFVWAGGAKAPELVRESGLEVGYNGRVKVDQFLRALDHPEVYAAGDLASVTDRETGRALPALAQLALDEAETVVRNLEAEMTGKPLEAFSFRNKGFVVSVGTSRGVAAVAGVTIGGRLAHALKDAIEWEYRQSVKHQRGWSPF